MQLELSLLGPLHVTWAGLPAVFATNAARALLAYLAIEGDRPHSREALAALLWPDQPQAAAYTNFRQTLARLRRALPDPATYDVLEITPQTVKFKRAAATLDVTRFEALLAESAAHTHAQLDGCPACMERLKQAIALYRGELLAGLFLEGSQPFDEWLLFKR